MTISDKGALFICGFEGFRSKAYQDTAGIWTIGFGTTHYKNGISVAPEDSAIKREEGILLMHVHITKEIAPQLSKLLNNLKQSEFDALCSFIYNVGYGNFTKSGLLAAIKAGADANTIVNEFNKWNKAGGKVLEGLVKRRAAEGHLYCQGVY